jgi:dihydropteroate synthase
MMKTDTCRMRLITKRFNFDLSQRPHLMGILNITPDSFSDGGHYLDPERALERAWEMVEEGADLIDIGGESSRPGAQSISVEEELQRTIPIIQVLAKKIPVPLSVDTVKAKVAEAALDKGASIINDISALNFDSQMAAVIARYRAPVILMHMLGNPRTMQQDPIYSDLIGQIKQYLNDNLRKAEDQGVEQIILDPGIGFGKTVEHNLRILQELDKLLDLKRPLLIGASRKSFIGNVLDLPVDDRLEGSLAVACWAAIKGVHIIRIHDVKQTRRVLGMIEAIQKPIRG